MNAILLGCLWVLAAAGVALLPMRYQYLPGLALLLAAPVILWMLWQQHGAIPVVIGLVAVLSMFRKPLRYFLLRALGRAPRRPGVRS